MTAYYNEIDHLRAEWLRAMMADGMIPDGTVDERSIWDVKPDELMGYTQCHFFAGVGGWPIALRLAKWPDNQPVWTGSCPCQPFSQAGRGAGFADERHLWPAFFWLIKQCRPQVVFGEQVASKAGLAWLDLVSSDLERAGYAVGAADLCAAGVGAPHIRQRLWFGAARMADSVQKGRQVIARRSGPAKQDGRTVTDPSCRVGNTILPGRSAQPSKLGKAQGAKKADTACSSGWNGDGDCRVVHANEDRCETRSTATKETRHRSSVDTAGWDDFEWLPCADGKARPVESGVRQLAYGLPGPSPAIAPYGDAIVPQVAALFIESFIESLEVEK